MIKRKEKIIIDEQGRKLHMTCLCGKHKINDPFESKQARKEFSDFLHEMNVPEGDVQRFWQNYNRQKNEGFVY